MKPRSEVLTRETLVRYRDLYVINCNQFSSKENILRNIDFTSTLEDVLVINDKYDIYSNIRNKDYENVVIFLTEPIKKVVKHSTFIVCPYVRYWYYYMLKRGLSKDKYLDIYRSLKFDLNSFYL